MSVPDHFRRLAQRCRGLSKTADEPEVIEQMRVWAIDLADEADQAERADWQPRRAPRNAAKHGSGSGSRGAPRAGFSVPKRDKYRG
jgi:hypothetical protein